MLTELNYNQLEIDDVRFVRVLWTDNAGLIRGKAIRLHQLSKLARSGLGMTQAVQSVPVLFDLPQKQSGLSPVGQVWLKPDLETFRRLPWCPTHASVMGDFVDEEGRPWAHCPRDALRRQLARLSAIGFTMQLSFENEFQLLGAKESSLVPLDLGRFAQIYDLNGRTDFLNHLAQSLESQNISVESTLKEAGWGQFETVVSHAEPLVAADRQVAFRETLHAVAAAHNLVATQLPVVFEKSAGNGCHIHFSLWHDAENLMFDVQKNNKLSIVAEHFLAGLMDHLPGLVGLTAPTTNSFRRLLPGMWSGAYRCWGYDHREAPLRVPTERAELGPTNIELKMADATANPYLAVTGLVAAGLDGLDRDLFPPPPSEEVPSPEEETDLERLPGSLNEALQALENDNVLTTALGVPLTRSYLAVKRCEEAVMRDWSLEEEVESILEAY